ncbi:MAG: oligosaccharide flippase family protein [Pseudomonadota bacterium]
MSHSPYGGKALRASTLSYLGGRLASAVLTFTAFALAARLLPLAEYGVYAAALALIELALALSTGGMEWVVARVLPESRMHAGGRATARLVLRLGAVQTLLMLAVGAALVLAAPAVGALLQMTGSVAVFRLAGAVVVAEGVGRLLRDQMLGVLMEQRSGQLAQAVRSGILMLQLLYAWHGGTALDAHAMLQLELVASCCGTVAGALLLARILKALMPVEAARPEWRPPPPAAMARLALHNFASYVLAMLYGPQVLTMLIARLLGADAVAVFGFARAFADQVRRYLPTDLLLTVVRPALIAFYAAGNNFSALSVRLGLWLKVSLMVLFPLLVFFAAFGALGMQALGGARFTQAWPVLLVLLCSAATSSWRRVLELGCNTVMASDICARATLVLVLVPPLLALALYLTQQLVLAVALVVAAEIVFCWRVVRSLRARGFTGQWDVRGFARLLAGGVGAVAVLLLLRQWWHFSLPVAVLTAGLAALAALRLALPLNAVEGVLVASWNTRLARLVGWYGNKLP